MTTLRYLAYGSNLCSARLAARVGAISVVGATALAGWRLEFIKRGQDGSGKCTLVRAAPALTHGAVYDIPAARRADLDRIEGSGYAADTLEVPGYGPCYVYLARPAACDPTLQPFDWYHALVLAGAREHGFPPPYIDDLNRVTVINDPDRERAARNLAAIAAPPGPT